MARKLKALYNGLVETIREGKKHKDYDRTVSIARDYRSFMTGDDTERFIKRFNLREDEAQFNIRKQLTIVTVQAITSRLTNPERKIPGAKPTVKKYGLKDNRDTKALKNLQGIIGSFYGGRGMDLFMKNVWMNYYDSDPNAFIVYQFSDFNGELDKKITYTQSVTSKEVLMFHHIDNVLQYLTFYTDIQYPAFSQSIDMAKPKLYKGKAFTSFGQDDQIVFTQVDPEFASQLPKYVLIKSTENGYEEVAVDDSFVPDEGAKYFYKFADKQVYQVIFNKHLSGRVPAGRVGNIPDLLTDGRTVVNSWHNALSYLEKSIKTVSELDISESFHAFPQSFAYQPRCQGSYYENQRIPCQDGWTPDNQKCSACGGSGWQVHKSGQDSIILGMPHDPEQLIDLKKLKTYIELPTGILEWLSGHVHEISEMAFESVYAKDIYSKERITNTATEKIIDLQSIYDTLSPVAKQYSDWWVFGHEQIAIYNDKKGLFYAEHVFPLNLKFESETEIISRIERAATAGVPSYMVEQFQDDLAESVYVNQPEILQAIKVKNKFNPFLGKDSAITLSLISRGSVTRYNEVLFINFSDIFTQLEEENMEKDGGFYSLTYKEQKKLIDIKVGAIIKQLDEEAPPDLPTNPFDSKEEPTEEGDDTQGATEVDDRLGKVPLAAQQISLAITRMKDAGFVDSANKLKKKFDEIIQEIDLTA